MSSQKQLQLLYPVLQPVNKLIVVIRRIHVEANLQLELHAIHKTRGAAQHDESGTAT
jgi:hypothetical protein